jgi:hypothetical protein
MTKTIAIAAFALIFAGNAAHSFETPETLAYLAQFEECGPKFQPIEVPASTGTTTNYVKNNRGWCANDAKGIDNTTFKPDAGSFSESGESGEGAE